MRIDGTITSTVERQRRINLYNTDHSYFCFLLTTQVGGLGITLTSADRVVICTFREILVKFKLSPNTSQLILLGILVTIRRWIECIVFLRQGMWLCTD
jgi:hypothetical protein